MGASRNEQPGSLIVNYFHFIPSGGSPATEISVSHKKKRRRWNAAVLSEREAASGNFLADSHTTLLHSYGLQ